MNESIAEREAQWDAFLQRWPLENLASMTLPQYSQAGDQDCFVYWLEAKTENLGSIWGGSAFKFGVYSRKDKSEKPNTVDRQYSPDYAWYAKYGDSPEQAFERVKRYITQIAKAARAGQLELVEDIDLGQVVKWKLAFLYQDRANPCVLPIYSLQNLQAIAGEGVPKRASDLYRALLRRRENEPLFAYADQLWALSCERLEESGAIEAVLKRFEVDPRFKKSMRNPEDRLLFYRLAVAAHERGWDWWAIKTEGDGSIRLGRNNSLEKSTTAVVAFFGPWQSGMQIKFNKRVGMEDELWRPLNESDIAVIEDPQFAADLLQANPLVNREARWPDEYRMEDSDLFEDEQLPDDVETNIQPMTIPALNQILFGPPGTGKTFSTIDEALKIIDQDFFNENAGNRSLLKARFDELVTAEQVRFVTFHQSFSYEDFVEGLRAETDDETKQISYNVEDGIFKQICLDARRPTTSNISLGVNEKPRIWKISIDGTNSSETRKYCYTNDEARIGWGYVGDLRETDLNDPSLKLGSNDRSCLRNFSQDIQPGDILLCIASSSEVGGVGVVQSEYSYDAKPPAGVMDDYKHVLKVKWILKGIHFSILPHNNQVLFTLKTVYELRRFNWTELALALEKSGHALPMFNTASKMQEPEKPHVLIIDEVNRGNISRIFGELITLIEPSKRAGKDEALEVTLPYSKKPFSVPSNLYLIGTMNTADRSLAGLDIALRRRFTFKEMPPRPELLDGVTIDGVDIGELLRTMNARIEVLLDADHCLGHAYFMPLKENKTLDKLAFIFRQQVLPLLQEYFFEDWERIAWVLNDQRKPSGLAFVQKPSADLASLFGADTASNLQDRRWRINEEAFSNIESYRRILGAMA